MKTSIQIARLWGIPIKLHITFLLALPLFTWVFTDSALQIGALTIGFSGIEDQFLKYALSLTTTILLFTCIALHELGHSWMAKRSGATIENITLMLFGGVASMEDIPKNPIAEARMASAGPLVSLGIGIALYVTHQVFNSFAGSGIMIMVGTLAYFNIILAIFNLIPAFPMDGGRVLRAIYATRMPYLKATHKAVYVGKMFAIFMGTVGFFYNVWLLLIAFFIYIGASEEEKGTKMSTTLEGIKISDIMSTGAKTISESMTVAQVLDFMLKNKHMGYPVTKDNIQGSETSMKNIVGIVTYTDVRKVLLTDQVDMKVSTVMTTNIISVSPDDDAIEALKKISVYNIGRLLVINNGQLVGIVSRTDIVRSLKILDSKQN